MIHLVAYGDFNCPFSALASARLAELEARDEVTVDWRAIEHAPEIPAPGSPMTGELAEQMTEELDRIRRMLAPGEPDRLRLPERQVNTSLATRRFAGSPPEDRPALRRALFAAHWQRSEPIDDAAALDRLGAGAPDPEVVDEWRSGWRHAATEPVVPVLVLASGEVRPGLDALAHLAMLLRPAA